MQKKKNNNNNNKKKVELQYDFKKVHVTLISEHTGITKQQLAEYVKQYTLWLEKVILTHTGTARQEESHTMAHKIKYINYKKHD